MTIEIHEMPLREFRHAYPKARLAFGHDAYDDESLHAFSGDVLYVAYLVPDRSRSREEYWGTSDGLGEYVEGDRAWRAARDAERDGKIWFPVNIYDHGIDVTVSADLEWEHLKEFHKWLGDWSPIDHNPEEIYPERVIVPCNDVQEKYQREKFHKGGKAAARRAALKDTNSVLDEWSKWMNGEVFGIVVETFDRTTFAPLDTDTVWGHIGIEYAREALREFLEEHLPGKAA